MVVMQLLNSCFCEYATTRRAWEVREYCIDFGRSGPEGVFML